MKKIYNSILSVVLLAFVLISSGQSYSQCGPLSTPQVTNNGQSGIMFDVVAITSVNVNQLAMDFDNGTYNIEVYYKAGTHVGFQTNAAAWTLLGTANAWAATGGTNVTIPVVINEMICAGDVGAFYVTANNGTGGNYSNGTGVGVVAAADANMQILQGTGKAYPFGTSFQPRVPNVRVSYTCTISCCLPPTMSMTQETCAGACNGTATATVGAGGIGPYAYQWDAAAGNQITQTAINLCAGIYTVTVTDATGCVSTGTITVTSGAIASDPTITPAGPFCVGDAILNLTAVDPGGTWTGAGITNGTTGEFDPAVAGVGTHTITYTILGACGAIGTEDIIVVALYDATITPIANPCVLDAPIILTAVDGGGAWTGTGITNAVTGEFDPGTAGAGLHTITYTIPGPCGDLQTLDITVDPALSAVITPVGPFCTAEPIITMVAVDPGGTWTGTGITNAATGTFDPATAGIGIHTITYTIPGACGDLQTTNIDIVAPFDATITPVGPYCVIEAAFNLSAVDPGGLWTGAGITDAIIGSFDPAVAGAGLHTITYSIPGACGDVQTTDILINPLDDPTTIPAGPFCLGTISTLNAVTAGGTWSGTGITNAATGTFNATTAGTGTHSITYTTNGPCPTSSTMDVQVRGALTLQAFGGTTICDGSPAYLSATGSGGDGNLNFAWTDPAGVGVGNGTAITVYPSVTTTYTVTLSDGCTTPTQSAIVTITVNPMPAVSFVVDQELGCTPLDVRFTNLSIPIGDDAVWSFGNGESATGIGQVDAQYLNTGCYNVTLTVTASGCTSTLTMPSMVCVAEQPVAEFTSSAIDLDILDTEVEFTNQSINAESYTWDFDNGTTSSAIDPIVMFEEVSAGYTVCLDAYNSFGCHDTVCHAVTINDLLLYFMPNTFTPDGNEFNQTLKPVFTSGFDPYDFNFQIFNRWGEVIWESHDHTVGWDGTSNGGSKNVEAGMYVWSIDFKTIMNDERKKITGHVNLLR
jgi:gliding motility-associated-like protein